MKTIQVQWTGIRPILMSNPQAVDVQNPYAIEARKINAALKNARKKEDESMMQELSMKQKKNDFCSSAYFDDAEKKFFIPDTVLLACIKEAAKSMKKGKDIDRAVIIEETQAYVENVPSVKSLEDAYSKPEFRFSCPAKIPPKTGSLVWKMRCMMPTGWRLKFKIVFDEDFITEDSIIQCGKKCGETVGVCGWRPKFGRFVAEQI